MVMRKLSTEERWQAVGMSQTALNNRRVVQRVGVHHSVIDRLMDHFQATGTEEDRPRLGRLVKLPLERICSLLVVPGGIILPRLVVYLPVCISGAMCLFGL